MSVDLRIVRWETQHHLSWKRPRKVRLQLRVCQHWIHYKVTSTLSNVLLPSFAHTELLLYNLRGKSPVAPTDLGSTGVQLSTAQPHRWLGCSEAVLSVLLWGVLSLCTPFHWRSVGQMTAVILSWRMGEVWEASRSCQCFSPSPLKGIKETVSDAICTVRGKVWVSGSGCSSRAVQKVRPGMAMTAVSWGWGTQAGYARRFAWFLSGASVISSALITSSPSYWTCQRSGNVSGIAWHPLCFFALVTY